VADERIGIRHSGGGNHFLVGRIQAPIADIVHDGFGEQVRILQHDPQLAPQVGSSDIANVDAVNRDAARIHIVEARQHVDDGCLTGSGRPDQRDRLPRLRDQVDALEHGHVGDVAKRHIFELDPARYRLERQRVRNVVQLRHFVQDLEDALGSGQC